MRAPPSPARNDAKANVRSLIVGDGDADGRRRPLVRAHRQHLAATAGPHDVAHEDEGDRRPRRRTKIPNGSAGDVAPVRTDRSMPNERRVGYEVERGFETICGLPKTNFSDVTAAASVTTASCAPRMRRAGRPTMTPAAPAMTGREQQRERERHAGTDLRQDEAGHAGERGLRQRYLTDHAGQDHERQGDQRAGQAGDHAEAVAARRQADDQDAGRERGRR